MEKVISYSLSENYIHNLASFIEENYIRKAKDISNLALVFGGRRPELFLKRELSARIGKTFFGPKFFSMDEFAEYVVAKNKPFRKISDLDSCFLIYRLSREIAPDILKEKEDFSLFLPWAREILSFIEQLDLEEIRLIELNRIQLNASIGYDVPPSINSLLEKITLIRDAYHSELKKREAYTRGLIYLLASEAVKGADFSEFSEIFFCNLFYLHKTESRIAEALLAKEKAVFVFQGDEQDWPVLKKLSTCLSYPIKPRANTLGEECELWMGAGFDLHSQVGLARDILKGIKDKDKTVIVLPNPESLIPLLSEISAEAGDFNVSIGYPLKRSPVYSLFECVSKAQETKKAEGYYYVKDYLRLLAHPLAKNLRLAANEPSVVRVLTHKIEEILTGRDKTAVSGSLFFQLAEIEELRDIYELTLITLKGMDISISYIELKNILKELHQLFFCSWEAPGNFRDFTLSLDNVIGILLNKGSLGSYPLNLKILERIFSIKEELERSEFGLEVFKREDMFRIFMNKLDHEITAFSGSPLKGLQILGLLETRSLNFENVLILDVNENSLPKLKIYEPLVPREVMISLGLNRLEKEEEIQRYQFKRLLSGARKVYLIYEESSKKEKSRFVEELLWERQLAQGALEVMEIPRAVFEVKISPEKANKPKNKKIIEFLEGIEYSASSINTYLGCPLRFYYQYVLGLREKDIISEEPESSDVGVFIHDLLYEAYSGLVGKKPLINQRFRDRFFRLLEKNFEAEFKRKMKSDAFMIKKIMRIRLEWFLDNEANREVDQIIGLELELKDELMIGEKSFRFTCRLDRIDRLSDGSLLVLDYKTAGAELPVVSAVVRQAHYTSNYTERSRSVEPPKGAGNLPEEDFSRETLRDTVKSFQLPLYLYFAQKIYPGQDINAALYTLNDLGKNLGLKELFKKDKGLEVKEKTMQFYLKALEFILRDILNPDIPFSADTSGYNKCGYCQFGYLCR